MPQPCSYSEAVAKRCSVKKEFMRDSLNSQENTCDRFSFLIEHLRWLLLRIILESWSV